MLEKIKHNAIIKNALRILCFISHLQRFGMVAFLDSYHLLDGRQLLVIKVTTPFASSKEEELA
jgi:hypothetical protein